MQCGRFDRCSRSYQRRTFFGRLRMKPGVKEGAGLDKEKARVPRLGLFLYRTYAEFCVGSTLDVERQFPVLQSLSIANQQPPKYPTR
jgi:hypothetical protein